MLRSRRLTIKATTRSLIDRGIWNWAKPEIRKNLRVFCEAGECNPKDILLNPCLAMVKANGAPLEANDAATLYAPADERSLKELSATSPTRRASPIAS